jgi:hypothetical protein
MDGPTARRSLAVLVVSLLTTPGHQWDGQEIAEQSATGWLIGGPK